MRRLFKPQNPIDLYFESTTEVTDENEFKSAIQYFFKSDNYKCEFHFATIEIAFERHGPKKFALRIDGVFIGYFSDYKGLELALETNIFKT